MARVTPETAIEDDLEVEDFAEEDFSGEDFGELVLPAEDGLPPAYIVTPEAGRRMYDEAVRKYMGMSGEEFLRRWDAGEFHELYDDSEHWYVGYLVDIRSLAEQEP